MDNDDRMYHVQTKTELRINYYQSTTVVPFKKGQEPLMKAL